MQFSTLFIQCCLFNGNLTSIVEAKNLFDTYYNQHTSIANIPESGRSFMLTLKYSL